MNKKKTSRQKYINEGEYKSILRQISNPFDYFLIFLCGNLGLRVGELVRLRVCDIMTDNNGYYLHVPTLKKSSKKGMRVGSIKSGVLPERYEDIPLHPDLANMMLEHISKFKLKAWIFPYKGLIQRKDLHLTEYTAARHFKHYAKMAGLDPHYSIHSLRHFKGFQIYKQKSDLKAVQSILRHSSIKTSMIYADMDLDSKRKIIDDVGVVK